MRVPRFLWLGATTAAIGILLILIALETRQKGRDTMQPGHGLVSIAVDPDDPQRLYLGTDLGVMVSIDGGRTWMTEFGCSGGIHLVPAPSLTVAAAPAAKAQFAGPRNRQASAHAQCPHEGPFTAGEID